MGTLHLMVGLSASGKSTLAKKIKDDNTDIHSSDSIREEIFNDINYQGDNDKVFGTLHERVNQSLADGKDVIYDATNLSAKRRRHYLNYILSKDTYIIGHVLATPYELCLERNLERDRSIPNHVIERQYKHFYMPHYLEGFDEIKIHYDYGNKQEYINKYNLNKKIQILSEIEQNNHNHSLTIGEHMKDAFANFVLSSDRPLSISDTIADALLLHDIGKQFCMQFKDYKGRPTDIAHYYNHENVGAYDTMFYLGESDEHVVEVCNLIQYHMRPYFWTENSKEKMIRFFDKNFVDKLELINKYDKSAK